MKFVVVCSKDEVANCNDVPAIEEIIVSSKEEKCLILVAGFLGL